jgi:hypothetical protein
VRTSDTAAAYALIFQAAWDLPLPFSFSSNLPIAMSNRMKSQSGKLPRFQRWIPFPAMKKKMKTDNLIRFESMQLPHEKTGWIKAK